MSDKVIEVQGEDVLPENKGEVSLVINPEDFGIAVDKAAVIESSFIELSTERDSLRQEYAQLMKQAKTLTSCKQAKELSKRIAKNRTRTAATYKTEKEVYLRGGQFIDALRNRDIKANSNMEERLNEYAEHFEKIEADRIEKLAENRDAELRKYIDVIPAGLGSMLDEVYDFYLASAKKDFNEKEEKKKLEAEATRIEELNASRQVILADYWSLVPEEDKEDDFGQWTDERFETNLTLLKEAKRVADEETKTARLKAEAEAEERRIADEKKQAELQKELDAAKKIADQKEAELKAQKAAADKAAKKAADDKAAADKIAADLLAAEKAKSDKLAADLAAIEKKKADERAAKAISDAAIKAEQEKLAAAPDKEKLSSWVECMTLDSTVTINTPKALSVKNDIDTKFQSFKTWAKAQIKAI